jgi:hypothetical protein
MEVLYATTTMPRCHDAMIEQCDFHHLTACVLSAGLPTRTLITMIPLYMIRVGLSHLAAFARQAKQRGWFSGLNVVARVVTGWVRVL